MYKPKDLTDVEKGKVVLAEEPQRKKRVSEEYITEFIKMLKRREDLVMEQLKKLPAHISIPSLLLSSEAHRDALLKILNESYI